MIEPSALTKSSPHAAGAECTAVGSRLLKPKRARAGKEESGIGPIISSAVVALSASGGKGPSRRIEVLPSDWPRQRYGRIRSHCPSGARGSRPGGNVYRAPLGERERGIAGCQQFDRSERCRNAADLTSQRGASSGPGEFSPLSSSLNISLPVPPAILTSTFGKRSA